MSLSARYIVALLPGVAAWLCLRRWNVLDGAAGVAAAFGLGLGGSATGFFAARVLGLPITAYLWLEGLVCLMVSLAALRTPPHDHRSRLPAPVHASLISGGLGVAVVAMAVMGVVAFSRYQLITHPFGTSDTWAIWNVRAAFMATEGSSWLDTFMGGVPLSHQDYPLLLPGAVARLWSLVEGGPSPAGYLSVSILVATTLLLSGAVSARAGTAGMVASLGLLLTPEFVRQGATQHADLLVGFYSLLALVLLAHAPLSSSRVVCAGAACGFAAWTKNEGLIVAIVLPVLTVLASWRARGRSEAATVAADFAIGLGPLVVLIALFKMLLAPENDVVTGVFSPGAFSYWMDPVRVTFVLREMARGLWHWGGWPWVPAIVAVVLVAAIPKPPERSVTAAAPPLAVALLATQLLSFFAVYVMTPHSVAWHVATSWSRLIAQLWPTMVWCACTARISANAWNGLLPGELATHARAEPGAYATNNSNESSRR
jgi:hypothetical protein